VVELKILKDENKELKVEFEDLDLGLANYVVDGLLKEKDVEFASASYTHPLEGCVVITIKAPNAKKALAKAVKASAAELEAVRKALE